MLYYNGNLGVFRFIKSGSTYGYNIGLKGTLQVSAGVYSIHYDNGDIETFNTSNNKISKLEDRNGNNLTFTYTSDLLTTVTDTLGRNVTYTYYSHNRLKDVTAYDGKKVEFTYFTANTSTGSLYDLQQVKINN